LIKFDKRWGETNTWDTIKRIGDRYTGVQYLAALDLKMGPEGRIIAQPEDRQIYVKIFLRTLWISLSGYINLPVACVSRFVFAGHSSFANKQYIDGDGFVAILDVAACADDLLDCSASEKRGG
jgi:hypothetical protein